MSSPSLTKRIGSSSLGSDGRTPLYRQIYDRLRQGILSGNLRPGSKLPSTRALAAELGIARNTVLGAYEQLHAEGYLEGQLGSGSYVSKALPEKLLHAPRQGPHRTPVEARLPSLSRRGLALSGFASPPIRQQEKACAFRHGIPAVEAFPFELWGRLTARLWRGKPGHLLSHGEPAGYRPLREAIAAYLSTSRGVTCSPDQVIIVSGSQQALDVAARVLLDPNDAAWIEDPGYLGARGALQAAGARLIPVPVDHEGFALPQDAAKPKRIRLAYVTPAHQYPLGITMSMARRLALIQWANRANAWILEDDYDSEFRYAGRPLAALQGIDTQGRVIYVGTFSKVMFPSLRLGYLVVPRPLVDAFVRARSLADGHSPTATQSVLAEFISAGHFARHLRKMRRLYAERQEIFLHAARSLSELLDIRPCDAGMHLIGWLDEGIDDHAVVRHAAAAGVFMTPLSSLTLSRPKRGGLLLGYTAIDSRAIGEGVRKLVSVLHDVLRTQKQPPTSDKSRLL
jgi:GntR family transcriptional regulator/MocR family aminotransferase